MSEWKAWGHGVWNERLLDYFFARRGDLQTPVVTLLVTSDVLARVTEDPGSKPEEARNAFVAAVKTAIRDKGLLDHASNYQAWPKPPSRGMTPRFVAHLIFTCVAAAESSEELGSEESFIERLGKLSDGCLAPNSLTQLPILWKNLADWLGANQQEYRQLQLPDPGNFTRIGHTVKLAFPDRRDQKALSILLEEIGMSGNEPVVGRVLSAVGADKSAFRPPFLAAFQEFRSLHLGTRDQASLLSHRFWAATREAALRGRGHGHDYHDHDGAGRVTLLGEDRDDRFTFFAAADRSISIAHGKFLKLRFEYGPWAFGLMPDGAEEVEADGLNAMASSLLCMTRCMPRVSAQVEQGLIPFVDASHGLYELASRDQVSECSYMLLRQDLLTDFVRLVDPMARARQSLYDGWLQIRAPRLSALSFEVLRGSTLERTWLLQESIVPPRIRLRAGVRADEGWLGVAEVLPEVVAEGATSITLEAPSGSLELEMGQQSSWSLPLQDLAGEFSLSAWREGMLLARRKISFLAAPASEKFKSPVEPEAWIVEGMAGTNTMAGSTLVGDDESGEDLQIYTDRQAHLGADVGVFVDSPQEAAWSAVRFGGRTFVGRGFAYSPDNPLERQTADQNSRSRWRKILFNGEPSMADPQFDQARRAIKTRASRSDLERMVVQQQIPDLNGPDMPPTSPRVDRLISVISGRATVRAGIGWKEWKELALRVFQIDHARMKMLTRAWNEAGVFDVATSSRWRHTVIFPRPPVLVTYRSGHWIGATLVGMCLPTTRDLLCRKASSLGAPIEERRSVSEFVPGTIVLRLADVNQLVELCRDTGLQHKWMNFEGLSFHDTHDPTCSSPLYYQESQRWSRWGMDSFEHDASTVEFVHFSRKDKPDFWQVGAGNTSRWSYSLNVARLWAASLSGLPLTKQDSGADLVAEHAFLPLSLARAANWLGSAISGPPPRGKFRYPVGNHTLRKALVEKLERSFELRDFVTTNQEGDVCSIR